MIAMTGSMPRRLAAAVTAAALLAPARAGRADPPAPTGQRSEEVAAQATAHLSRGIELFTSKEYELAITEFEAGYALDPRPDFLFALAQAERLSGDCASAVLYYRDFLATSPGEKQTEAAQANLERCERVLSTSRARSAAEAEKPAEPARSPSPADTARGAEERRPTAPAAAVAAPAPAAAGPWYTDVLGDALLAGGVAAAAAGGYFWMRSSDSRQAAVFAERYSDYVRHMDDARTERAIAIGAVATGGALAAAAVVRYLTRGGDEERGVALEPASGGVLITVRGAF